jgi:hypothetical protein
MLVYLIMAMDLPAWALKAIDKIRSFPLEMEDRGERTLLIGLGPR